MKKSIRTILILPFALALLTVLPSCEKKGPGEEIGEAIDDATNSRPGEPIKDAIENAADAVDDAVKN